MVRALLLLFALSPLGCADEPASQAQRGFGARVGAGGPRAEARSVNQSSSFKLSRGMAVSPTYRMQSRSFQLTTALKAVNR